jgi:imidazolonepropionase-like amidohydrolase
MPSLSFAQAPAATLLHPAAVFDGYELHPGWAVLIEGQKITAAGPAAQLGSPSGVRTVELPGLTLLPGLIEGHSHLLLHPYNETSWNDQVLLEPLALRVARATVHAQKTLLAGFTTARDLGTEGAGYADVGLKQAINEGIIPGPRLLVATRALVATGSYGPHLAAVEDLPQGAQEADGVDNLVRAVREQISHGADVVKVYADYRWGLGGAAEPTYSLEELTLIVQTARAAGRGVVAHASTAEGMRRATLAGVETIEHGDGGTPEVFKLMKARGVALCPTVAASDAISRYRGWRGAGCPPSRRDPSHGGRCGRVSARRQCPGNGVAGARLWLYGARSVAPGYQWQRPHFSPGRPRPRGCRLARRPRGRGRRPHPAGAGPAPSAPRDEGWGALQTALKSQAPASLVDTPRTLRPAFLCVGGLACGPFPLSFYEKTC